MRRRKFIALLLGGVAAWPTLLIPTGPADAQNYPWCAQRGDGGTNCGFVSYEQCMAAGRWCNPNPMYQPPTRALQPRRGTRRTRG